jgi:nitroreductase
MTTTANDALAVILSRRSIASLTEPGPTDQQLHDVLAAATTVPDHGSLTPWRFVVVRGAGRDEFGSALADAALEVDPEIPEKGQEKLRNKAFLAPVLVVVIASPQPSGKVPEWEQVASASCTGYALALGAHTVGLGAVWKSANQLAGRRLTELLSLTPEERILGWVAIGTPTKEDPRPPNEPAPHDHTSVLDGPALQPYQS